MLGDAGLSRRDTSLVKLAYLEHLPLGAQLGARGWVHRAMRMRIAESRVDRHLVADVVKRRHYHGAWPCPPKTLILSYLIGLDGVTGPAGAGGVVMVALLPNQYHVRPALGLHQCEVLTLVRMWRADDLVPAVPDFTPEMLRRVVRGERSRGQLRDVATEWCARKLRAGGLRARPRLLGKGWHWLLDSGYNALHHNEEATMGAKTGIEWTNRTWNPTTGCDKISPGCKHCYAETQAARLKEMGNPRYKNGFELTLHPDKLEEPLGWRGASELVFVNSMSDLLHKDVPDDFIVRAFETMTKANWHTYQVLTKRADRWPAISDLVVKRLGKWPANVLPGTSIESADHLHRLEHLKLAGDADTIRMISFEPLLNSLIGTPPRPTGSTDPKAAEEEFQTRRAGAVLKLADRMVHNRVGWAITGGESGYKARESEIEWFREIRDACALAGIPFFHKQHGGIGNTKEQKRGGTLALLDGELHHAMPAVKIGPLPTGKRKPGTKTTLPLF